MSQTPDAQTSIPIVVAGLQWPFNVGVCPATVGMLPSLAIFAVHVALGVSQYWVDAQSESTAQPHVSPVVQTPDRQTAAAVPAVHVPSPAAKPHLSSVSQTPERQIVTPEVAGVQVPSPFANPHLSSVSHTPERQTATPEVPGVQLPSLFA